MSLLGKKSKDKKRERELRQRLGIDQKVLEDFHTTFRLMDRDKSGSISHEEFKEVVAKSKTRSTDQEIRDMIAKADLDNSGSIEFEEFAEMMAMKYKENKAWECEIRETFKCFDTNKDGFICRRELREGMKSISERPLTDAELDDIIRTADKDGDGFLSLKEFSEYIIENQ
ncbi:calmodulin-1-like [Haliotis rubra]|uniref:calmodulin-1-like n=1 Tax=Haliotis rubra TaxID=36100 RepID=UPI001EE52AC1|nr:calmodulin-1-like [Haliotis rubra]